MRAIEADNDLAGEESQAEANDAVGAMLRQIMMSGGKATDSIPHVMLSGPRRKFCEGVVSGLNASDAYREAYPRATRRNATASSCRLMKEDAVKAEIGRLRAAAEEMGGQRC